MRTINESCLFGLCQYLAAWSVAKASCAQILHVEISNISYRDLFAIACHAHHKTRRKTICSSTTMTRILPPSHSHESWPRGDAANEDTCFVLLVWSNPLVAGPLHINIYKGILEFLSSTIFLIIITFSFCHNGFFFKFLNRDFVIIQTTQDTRNLNEPNGEESNANMVQPSDMYIGNFLSSYSNYVKPQKCQCTSHILTWGCDQNPTSMHLPS